MTNFVALGMQYHFIWDAIWYLLCIAVFMIIDGTSRTSVPAQAFFYV